MLMQLNEHAGRIDNQIEKVCSKFEKMAFDNGATELLYHDEQNDKQIKYRDFICNFSWNVRKFN